MSVSKWRYTEECNGRPCPGDCDHCSFEPADLISRADAIEALRGLFDMRKSRAKVIVECFGELLKALPSAELPKGELISRADAIEAVAGLVASEYVVKDGEHGFYTCASVAQNVLSALPSAEAIQGEWEHWGSPFSDESDVIDTIVCSVCGARFIEPKDEYNYCPNCGARMKGGAK